MALAILIATLAPASAQTLSDEEHREVETLLETADWDGVRTWLDAPGQRDAAPRLQAALQRVDALLADSSSQTYVYMDQRLRMSERFTDALSGPVAASLYRQFAEQAQNRDYRASVPYFEAAQYLRRRHEEGIGERLQVARADADALFAQGNMAAADSVLAEVRPYFGSPAPAHQDDVKRLRLVDAQVREALAYDVRQEQFFEQTERTSHRVALALGGGIVQRGGTGPVRLDVQGIPRFGDEIDLVGFGDSTTPVFSAEGYVYLTSFLALGAGASWNRAEYTNRDEPEVFFVDFPITSVAGYGSVRALLRTEVGLRPYVSAGVGALRMSREASGGALQQRGEIGLEVIPFTVSSETRTGTQVRTGVGFEYLACGSCAFAPGAELSLTRNLIDSAFAPDWQVALGVKLFVMQ